MNELLENQGSGLTIAELHGFLIGAFTVSNDLSQDKWLAAANTILEIEIDTQLKGIIESFRLLTEREKDESLLTTVLVPTDDNSLQERFFALRNWAMSFSLAFNLFNQASLNEEQTEVLENLQNIAKTMLDNIEESNENEEDYQNILDFVQAAPLLLIDA
jgi:uncharacterized protein YgfB (UPF0149 family)